MIDIETFFSGVQTFTGDIWVADYTEATKNKLKTNRKGVVIQGSVFSDIASFHLQNARQIDILAVNFERNKSFFPHGVKDCECMFRPKGVNKGWLLLCELKYCKQANIFDNAAKAYSQLVDTWKLVDKQGFYDRKHCKVYLNISIPEHTDRSPFTAFVVNQDEHIEFRKKHRIILLGVNDLLVVDSGIIKVDSPSI